MTFASVRQRPEDPSADLDSAHMVLVTGLTRRAVLEPI